MRPSAPPLEPRGLAGSPIKQLLCVWGLALAGTAACTPPTPAQKATDAARDLNMAARWGRMEEATKHASAEGREEFVKRRENWHDEVRILETEVSGLDMKDATHASVKVDVSWMFDDDPTLRNTRLAQEWSDEEGHWEMVKEEQESGDVGLFGEEVKRVERTRDRHFPTRTIR